MATTNTKQVNRKNSADVETAILEAARDLLAEGGVAGLSMRQIADRVGVTATAIYHYFDGKQALINRVVLSAFERFGSYLKDAMNAHPKGSVERVIALGEAYLRFALEDQAYFRVLFSIQPKPRAAMEKLPEDGGYHLLRQAVSEAIDAGTIGEAHSAVADAMDSGVVRKANADLVSMYLWSVAHGLVTLSLCGASDQCHREGQPSGVDLLRAFMPFVMDGIRVPVADSDKNE